MGRFEEMQNFVRVVEAGSISGAAEQMGVAKSGVSRRLGELEARLGVRLLNRTTRRSSLTDAGRGYYERAVRLLGDVAELDTLTSGREAGLEGTLRLAVPLSFGLCHLSSAVNDFMRLHPGLAIDIHFSDRHIDLVEQGVDLAIRIAELQDSSLQARRICPVRLLLCASPGYLREHGNPAHPSELKTHRVLHYALGERGPLKLQDDAGREFRVSGQPPIRANNGDFLRDMAVAGHGIIVIPSFIAWQELSRGELREVLPGYRPRQLDAWAVYPRNRFLSQRARVFIDFLVERFGEEPYWDERL